MANNFPTRTKKEAVFQDHTPKADYQKSAHKKMGNAAPSAPFKNTKSGYQDAHYDTNAFSKAGSVVGGGSPANAHQVGNSTKQGALRVSGKAGAHQIGKRK